LTRAEAARRELEIKLLPAPPHKHVPSSHRRLWLLLIPGEKACGFLAFRGLSAAPLGTLGEQRRDFPTNTLATARKSRGQDLRSLQCNAPTDAARR